MLEMRVLLISLCFISISWANVYKWTDENGIVHFSDTPHPGSQSIKLPAAQPFNNNSQNQIITSRPIENSVTNSAEIDYDNLIISQPKDAETIRNNEGYVPVIVEIMPDLKTEDKLQLLYDGAPIGEPQNALVFTLKNVYRGTHTIAVQVQSADGTVINTSDQVTFYMQRPRVGMVPNTKPKNTP